MVTLPAISTPSAARLAPVDILLVDDEPRNLDVLESLLQAPEYNLVRAVTADQALMLLLDREFAVIVLDIQMPKMTGLELAALIKQRRRTQHIPIIFLTAYFQEDKDVLQGYGSGAVDYLTKPINPQILRSKIAVFVDLFRKTQALATINAALELEIAQRLKAEDLLRQTNNELESRVHERTADLVRVNEELRAREKALRASEAQALEASRAKDDFLARLSHELRTPLSPVLLLATEAAANPALAVEVRTDFETIAQNVALEARLIDDLLDLTAITRGKLALEQKPVAIHGVLHAALALVRQEIARKQFRLALQFDAGRDTVRGDDMRLKQIFWNVIKNAAKFTPDAGEIVISTAVRPDDQRLLVRIRDSGIGMTADEISRIFAAFAQGDHAVRDGPRFGGLGLGLVISRMLVELHSGAITVTSGGRDRGCTFTVELPLVDAPSRTAADTAPALPTASVPLVAPRTLRVLLVEDHPPTSATLKELLTRRQFHVVTAATIGAARAIAAAEKLDLVISDIGLPDGNGCDLMTELRSHHGLRGVALTGFGTAEDRERSHAAGFVAHLTKPVSIRALDDALAGIVSAFPTSSTESRSA